MVGLSEDDLGDAEGEALLALRAAHLDPHEPVSAVELCTRLTGCPPRYAQQRADGQLVGDAITLRYGVRPSRVPGLLAHELGHWWYQRRGDHDDPRIELRCDAFALAVLAPRPAFERALRHVGHRVHRLADAFAVSQSFALLRVGEVARRPVALVLGRDVVTRGGPFVWTDDPLRAARDSGWSIAHPLRITDDDPGRVGLMAR